jgi:hypothetical protein
MASMNKQENYANETLRNAIKNLPPVNIIIPFSTELIDLINSEASLMRTMTLKLLDIIKASTALHQFQREKDEHGNILATKEDLAYAIFVATYCDVLTGQTLNRKQEELINYVIGKGEATSFKQIIADNPGMSEAWIYRQEKDLVERRILQMTKEYDVASGRDVKCFKPDTFLNIQIKVPVDLSGYFTYGLEKDINENRKKFGLKAIKLFGEKK